MTNNMNKQHMFREVFIERSLEWEGGDKREPDNWHLREALWDSFPDKCSLYPVCTEQK